MMSEWEWHRRAAQSLAAHHNTRAFDHIEEARRHLQESWLQLALLRDHELTLAEIAATTLQARYDAPGGRLPEDRR